jgi:hypothetical protein
MNTKGWALGGGSSGMEPDRHTRRGKGAPARDCGVSRLPRLRCCCRRVQVFLQHPPLSPHSPQDMPAVINRRPYSHSRLYLGQLLHLCIYIHMCVCACVCLCVSGEA